MFKNNLACIILSVACSTFILAGCNNADNLNTEGNTAETEIDIKQEQSDGVAGKVNDVDILEDDVTKYINQYRLYSNAEDDVSWATLLDESGTDIESIRLSAINQLAANIVIEQKAEELGLKLTSDELDAEIESRRKTVGLTNDDKWKSLLDTSGYDEKTYRKDVESYILLERLYKKECPPVTVEDIHLQSFLKDNPSSYVGKKIVNVVFESDQTVEVEKFLDEVGDSTTESTFREKAAGFVDNGQAVAVSSDLWTCIDEISEAIKSGVASVQPGGVVAITESDGAINVVFVIEEYSADKNGYPVFSDMPDQIKNKLKEDCTASMRTQAMSKYKQSLLDAVDVSVYDKPANMPYDVDMSLSVYGKETTAEEDEAAAQELIEEHIKNLEQTNTENAADGE